MVLSSITDVVKPKNQPPILEDLYNPFLVVLGIVILGMGLDETNVGISGMEISWGI